MSVTFHHTRLENGLVIIGEQDPNAHTTAGGFWVSTGARDERPELMGISHFLEHMMFKGTDKRSAEDVNRDFDSVGAVNNAFTSSEMTAYWPMSSRKDGCHHRDSLGHPRTESETG